MASELYYDLRPGVRFEVSFQIAGHNRARKGVLWDGCDRNRASVHGCLGDPGFTLHGVMVPILSFTRVPLHQGGSAWRTYRTLFSLGWTKTFSWTVPMMLPGEAFPESVVRNLRRKVGDLRDDPQSAGSPLLSAYSRWEEFAHCLGDEVSSVMGPVDDEATAFEVMSS